MDILTGILMILCSRVVAVIMKARAHHHAPAARPAWLSWRRLRKNI